METRVHQFVCKDYGLLQTEAAVTRVDQPGNLLFLQRLVQQPEGHTRRTDFGQQRPADGGVNQIGFVTFLAVLRNDGLINPHLDTRMQIDLFILKRPVHFIDVAEVHALPPGAFKLPGHVVQTKHHVLGGDDNWLAIGG